MPLIGSVTDATGTVSVKHVLKTVVNSTMKISSLPRCALPVVEEEPPQPTELVIAAAGMPAAMIHAECGTTRTSRPSATATNVPLHLALNSRLLLSLQLTLLETAARGTSKTLPAVELGMMKTLPPMTCAVHVSIAQPNLP